MTFALNLLAMSSSEVEWSRPLMMAWLVIALALSVIEVWLTIRRRRSLTLAQVSRFVPPWDQMQSKKQTLKGFLSGEPFQIYRNLNYVPRVLASSNPGLRLANAFGVNDGVKIANGF